MKVIKVKMGKDRTLHTPKSPDTDRYGGSDGQGHKGRMPRPSFFVPRRKPTKYQGAGGWDAREGR